jgi:tetratricopeptide (TPR) repeat protein
VPTSLKQTDPTYLRTIHDGLLSGAVHKDNASALPQGLVGMYEEALPPASSVRERKKFLEFFVVWALLKKEVSAGFVLPLLNGWTEEEVIDYIAQYSKWFNSPVSGKYVLYHERLRTFILQKASHHHFEKCNEKIIHQCQLALQAKVGNEWERYALEHLSSHILIKAMESSDGIAMKALAYDTTHWNRQIEISKEFEWSKSMLNDMMLWSSKYDEDEVIECALNKVDLHHMEQNDAPRIIELVAQNDIETALQRIESFGGNDKDGLQRKFILYMLCLMELTLLDSKDKPFRKEATEKLLKHLDENLPVDHSVLNWNDFLPSYFIFQMACEWAEAQLDYLSVYKRTCSWDFHWVGWKGPYSPTQFDVLLSSASDNEYCSLIVIKELAKQGDFKEALNSAYNICDDELKSAALAAISTFQGKCGLIDASFNTMGDALTCASGIEESETKSISMLIISDELISQGKLKQSITLLEDSITSISEISDDYEKSKLLKILSVKLAEQGAFELALTNVEAIKVEENRILALLSISTELFRRGQMERVSQVIQQAYTFVDKKSDDLNNHFLFGDIAVELLKQGKVNEALEIVNRIYDKEQMDAVLVDIAIQIVEIGFVEKAIDSIKEVKSAFERFRFTLALHSKLNMPGKLDEAQLLAEGLDDPYYISLAKCKISSELIKQNDIKKAGNLMQEALKSAFSISYNDEWNKCQVLKVLSIELANQGNIKASFDCFREGGDFFDSNGVLCSMNSEYSLKGMFREISIVFQEALSKVNGVLDPFKRVELLFSLLKNLVLIGRSKEAILFAQGLRDEDDRNRAISEISIGLIELGFIDKAIACAFLIEENYRKSYTLREISVELAKQGNLEFARTILLESLDSARLISDRHQNYVAIKAIAVEFVKRFSFEESYNCVRDIADIKDKSLVLKDIAAELFRQGKKEEAASVIAESLVYIEEISTERAKYRTLVSICAELANQGMIEKALNCIRDILDEKVKSQILSAIASELVKRGDIDIAITCYHDISEVSRRVFVLKEIINELAKKGKIEKAIELSQWVNDESDKSEILIDICLELACHFKNYDYKLIRQEAIDIARGIVLNKAKSRALIYICHKLVEMGNMEDALISTLDIPDVEGRSKMLIYISNELAKKGRLEEAEAVGIEIPQISERHNCWKQIAKENCKTKTWKLSLQQSLRYKSDQARLFYLNGWCEHLTIENITKELITEALPFIANDCESIEILLQKYSIKESLIGNSEASLQSRFNRSLNIQWAIDIKKT